MVVDSHQYDLVENFSGFQYISNAQLKDTGQTIEVEIERIPIRPMAIFMLCVVVTVLLSLIFSGFDSARVVGLSFAAAASGGLFIGLLWLVNQSSQDTSNFPLVDKVNEELALPCGTRIAKHEIGHFIQTECRTKISNFRLVLTIVVTTNQDKQYAVCAEIGTFKKSTIGHEIANYFGAQVSKSAEVVRSRELLEKLGLE